MSLEGNANAGEDVEAVEESGIERKTEAGQGVELDGIVGILRSEHSGSGGGGFGEWNGLIQHGDAGAVVMEFEGKGEADDACPGNADVIIRRRRVVHGISLVLLRRGYSLGVGVCRAVLVAGNRLHGSAGAKGRNNKTRSCKQ